MVKVSTSGGLGNALASTPKLQRHVLPRQWHAEDCTSADFGDLYGAIYAVSKEVILHTQFGYFAVQGRVPT